ncbi:MAG: Trk system potassium transporter TrkA [Planctomycetes bacterium]|nr:Trk system potassium transporter TrkA [Planctomycetota bacterium]
MNIIICGAGQVGLHAAEVMEAAGHNITVIDENATRIRKIEDGLDVRTLRGNCAAAETLVEAGCKSADLVVAATSSDEINILTAAVAKAVGADKTIVRVHHSTYFAQRCLDYKKHLGIDQLICPEYSTAQAIAQTLSNPGTFVIENFARGQVEMHEIPVSEKASAVGIALADLGLPRGTRLAAIGRGSDMFIPDGASVVKPDDRVVLVGNANVFQQARRLFHDDHVRRRRIAIMGGPPTAVWLCRALRKRDFSIRLFEENPERAEELAQKLDWVTVISADPSDVSTFEEEKLDKLHAFVALLDDDEHNILGSAWAKSKGVKQSVAVVQRSDYLHLLASVGIDRAFSPRMVAVRELERFIAGNSLQRIVSLAHGMIDVYRFHVGHKAHCVGKMLREIRLTPKGIVAAIQHGDHVEVPSADHILHADDTLLVIGQPGMESNLRKMFATK